jgi:endopolyphosphatase
MDTCELAAVFCRSSPALTQTFANLLRNIDHFFFIDVDELESTTQLKAKAESRNDRVHPLGRISDTALQQELYKDFSDMPKLSKVKWEDYAVIHVSPSVIPTYLPGIRVFR